LSGVLERLHVRERILFVPPESLRGGKD